MLLFGRSIRLLLDCLFLEVSFYLLDFFSKIKPIIKKDPSSSLYFKILGNGPLSGWFSLADDDDLLCILLKNYNPPPLNS